MGQEVTLSMPDMHVLVVHNRYSSAQPSGENRVVDEEAGLLRAAGHRVSVEVEWSGRDADLMLALHARRGGVELVQVEGGGYRPEERLATTDGSVVELNNVDATIDSKPNGAILASGSFDFHGEKVSFDTVIGARPAPVPQRP